MNPAINLITGFKRVKSEEGIEHYSGTFNLKSLKKVGNAEIEVVLLSTNALPKSLTDLMKKGGSAPDLLMFAESNQGELSSQDKQRSKRVAGGGFPGA